MTSSPWLRDYVLQGLGSEIRKQGGLSLSLSQQGQEQEQAAGQKQNLGGQQQQQHKSSTTRLVKIIARSSNFNNKRTSNRACCWLLVSDGSCSVKIHFTVQALEQIYDCDNNNNENSSKISANNNNNDCFFGRGCCILLKKYSVEYDLFHVGTSNNNNSNDGTVDLVNVIANLNNIDMERYPVRLKVSSLEAKPSFNNHITISANNTNNNNNNNNSNSIAAIRPVLEDIDVLYAIQYLKRQQQIQRNNNNNNNVGNGSGSGSRRSIARDWDIAFGRLSKGNFVANDGDTDDHDTTYDTSSSSRNLQQIINLADKACTTDEAIRVWDMAKNEYGINDNGNDDDTGDGGDDTGDGDIFNNNVNGAMAMTTNNKKTTTTTTTTNLPDQQDINKDGGCDDDDDNDADNDNDEEEEEEDHSRMYIQNVLATQEDEDDNNAEDENEDEEPLLLQTQPQSNTIATRNATTPSTVTSRNKKSILDTTQSPVTKIATVMQTQPPRDGVVDDAAPPIPPNKRPQISGTTDSPSMLESAKQYQQKRQRLHQEKQQPMQQQQDEEESSKNNIGTSIWESIKEQCFDESRPFLHFVPSWRIVSSGDNNNDIPITPNKKMKSTTSINYNNTDIGSVGSIGTNFALSSPNPSSGAYYKKYGLARWLKKNTAGDNNKDNDDDFVNGTINTPNTNHAN